MLKSNLTLTFSETCYWDDDIAVVPVSLYWCVHIWCDVAGGCGDGRLGQYMWAIWSTGHSVNNAYNSWHFSTCL